MIATVLLATSALLAGLVPMAPIEGECVRLVPDGQKDVMRLPALADRIRFLEAKRKDEKAGKSKDCWRKSLPLVLSVRATEGEKGPWKVLVGKSPDLSDARVWYRSSWRLPRMATRRCFRLMSEKEKWNDDDFFVCGFAPVGRIGADGAD